MPVNTGQPSDEMRSHMAGGRPALSDDERKRTTSVSLSRGALEYLRGIEEASDVSRSEVIEKLIEVHRDNPEPLLAAFRGERGPKPFTDAELAAVATVASASIAAWASTNADRERTVHEMKDATHWLYAAAASAVKANR